MAESLNEDKEPLIIASKISGTLQQDRPRKVSFL